VQNGGFTQTGGLRNQRARLRGQLTFTGVMSSFVFDGGADTSIRFAETATVKGKGGCYGFYGSPGPGTIIYDAPVPAANANELILQYGFDIHLNADYAFDLQWKNGTPPDGGLRVHGAGTIDLHGHDQRVGRVNGGSGSSHLTDDADLVFTSAEPATLFIVNTDYTDRPSQDRVNGKTFSLKGALSLDFSSPATMAQHMAFGNNDTTGSMIVRGGTFGLCRGAYWGGTNVTVAGGTLLIGADCRTNATTGAGRFFDRKTNLVIAETGATLEIGEGRTDSVRSLKLGDAFVPAGTYGGPLSSATQKLDCLAGTGLLRVRNSTDDPGLLLLVR